VGYRGVELKVLQADALRYSSDLLVLKHAQRSYGADERAVHIAGIDAKTLPIIGDSLLVKKPLGLAPRNLLFLGVEPIGSFSYRSIRDFSRRALAAAAGISPVVREISMTLHGLGFGLDEAEAFESEVAGIIQALDSGEYPESLGTVSIVERSAARANRIRGVLVELLGSDDAGKKPTGQYCLVKPLGVSLLTFPQRHAREFVDDLLIQPPCFHFPCCSDIFSPWAKPGLVLR